MSRNLFYANVVTLTPKEEWLRISNSERLDIVKNSLALNSQATNNILVPIAAKQDGQVIFQLLEPLAVDRRGTVLLDIEDFLKEAIDPGLTVWLASLGDRSSLRNLRGIEVKS